MGINGNSSFQFVQWLACRQKKSIDFIGRPKILDYGWFFRGLAPGTVIRQLSSSFLLRASLVPFLAMESNDSDASFTTPYHPNVDKKVFPSYSNFSRFILHHLLESWSAVEYCCARLWCRVIPQLCLSIARITSIFLSVWRQVLLLLFSLIYLFYFLGDSMDFSLCLSQERHGISLTKATSTHSNPRPSNTARRTVASALMQWACTLFCIQIFISRTKGATSMTLIRCLTKWKMECCIWILAS